MNASKKQKKKALSDFMKVRNTLIIICKNKTYMIEDFSVNHEDLFQEVSIKLYKGLLKFPHDPKKAGIKTYANKIATNHLINMRRREKAIYDGRFYDKSHSLSESITSSSDSYGDEIGLGDVIKSETPTPEEELEMLQLLEMVRNDLQQIIYQPVNFIVRMRSFCRKLFDTIVDDENFLKSYRNNFSVGVKEPSTVFALSEYLNVDVRSVTIGRGHIKQSIIRCAKKMEEIKERRKIYGKIEKVFRKEKEEVERIGNKNRRNGRRIKKGKQEGNKTKKRYPKIRKQN